MLLRRWSEGDRSAFDALVPVVYGELQRMASAQLNRERREHTLRPAALVHEAYLALVEQKPTAWRSREHFFAIASQVMRQILVAHARRRNAQKRGGKWDRITLDEAVSFASDCDGALEELDRALSELAVHDERKARIVEMRYFGGLTGEEIARLLSISVPTVTRDSRMAEAWLLDHLQRR